jgi:hypothetical protein
MIDLLEKSPFEQTNVFIGNEEDGAFRFMGNEIGDKPSGQRYDPSGRFGKEQMEFGGGMSGMFDSLLGVSASSGANQNQVAKDSNGRSVDKTTLIKEVDSLYNAKTALGKVNVDSYKRGDEAFKKGDREGVIKAVNDLKAQEDMLRDRWVLVSKTHADVLSPMNRALLFQDDGGLFSTGGGDKMAEQTKRLNEVKAEVRNAADKVTSRRRLLEFRLLRLDSVVPSESSVPRNVVVVNNEKSNDVIDSLKNPLKSSQDIFRGA